MEYPHQPLLAQVAEDDDNRTARIKYELAKRWLDPVQRCEDIFNIKTSRGDVVPYRCPPPHAEILREGPLGDARKLIDQGLVFRTVLNKGRQLGFSTMSAMETILMAEEFPNTTLYYIADDLDQGKDFLDKVEQLCKDANHYPGELGGGPILNIQDLKPVQQKKINDTYITALSGRAKGGKRGKNSVYVIWDEMAWCISVNNEQEEIWDVIQHYLKQGGCVRMQSTPRTTDDMFWKYYTKPQEFGVKAYYKPSIVNWKDLDLKQPLYIDLDNHRRSERQWGILEDDQIENIIKTYKPNERYVVDLDQMQIYQKNVQIPYPWVKLEELEIERADYEKFLQENLGVSVDEKYKVIPSEWIYRNVTLEPETEGRENSKNPFYILVDIAQVNDITAITIAEKLSDGTIIERKLDWSQDKYDVQSELIWSYFLKFKPQGISIDNTGHGRVLGDFLEKKLREGSYPISLLNRVNFTNSEKAVMAEGFRNLVQNDKYKFLNRTEIHAESIRHVERVEKEVLETNVRYSGKKWGRDDFFWSKAQIVYYTQLLMPAPPSSFGKVKRPILTLPEDKIKRKVSTEVNREEKQKDIEREPQDWQSMVKAKKIGKVLYEMKGGVVDCPKTMKIEKPVICTGCQWKHCMHWDSMEATVNLHGIKQEDVWEKQKVYPKELHDNYPKEGKHEGVREEKD